MTPMPRPLATLDLDLVRTFVTITQLGRFTRAATRLGRQQSTISLQIARLETALDVRLLERSPQGIRLTAAGERFLVHAERLLAANDAAVAELREPVMAGTVRLGTPEDFATSRLPEVLACFTHAYPAVALEVTCDLTLNLMEGFDAGRLDLVLAKRETGSRTARRGVRVWQEPLVWVGYLAVAPGPDQPVRLAVSPEPCVYRKRAIDALERAGLPWRIAYTCGALSGTIAAVKAGLGVAVLPRDMVPDGVPVCGTEALPALKDTEIALIDHGLLTAPGQRLKEHIIHALALP
jgi:DNA-binding transcriptional LysR family regulator